MTVTDITATDIEPGPVPRPDSPELAAFIAAVAADAERRRAAGGAEPPDAALAEVRRLRLGAVRVPAELGGGGWSVPELFDLLIDLAEADPDVPHILRIHFGFAEELLTQPRTAKKQQWLPHVVAGKIFGGALTELNNKPVGNYSYDSTLVPRSEGGYLLDGRKFYSTGSQFSDYIRVIAHLPEGGLLTAIVPGDRAGVEHVDDWDGIGQRHTGSGTTVLTNVVVAEDETLPWRNADLPVRPRQAFPQLYLHAIAAGILRSVASDGATVLRNRTRNFVFGNTDEPRHDPQLLEVVGSLSATAFAAESIVRAAAQAQTPSYDAARAEGFDAGLEHEAALQAAKAKVAIEESALRAAGQLFDVAGASATRASAHLDRHWRNLRTLFSHNPTVYKSRALGDLVVNEKALPEAGHF